MIGNYISSARLSNETFHDAEALIHGKNRMSIKRTGSKQIKFVAPKHQTLRALIITHFQCTEKCYQCNERFNWIYCISMNISFINTLYRRSDPFLEFSVEAFLSDKMSIHLFRLQIKYDSSESTHSLWVSYLWSANIKQTNDEWWIKAS